MIKEKCKVAIIGAGPAGLTAAYFLKNKGIKPTIFEGSKEIGGLAGSVNLWGMSFDIGPHIFIESSQSEAVGFWKDIGGNDLIKMELSRGMIVKNMLIHFPPKPLGLLQAFGLFSFSLAALSLVKARFLDSGKFSHSGAFFKKRYGNYFRNKVFNPFCEKYMGISDFKVDLNFATSLTSFVKESGKTDVITDEKKLKSLIYPKQGTKIIWQRIADKVLEHGEINFEKKLIKIDTKDNKVVKLFFSDGTEIIPEFVITSLPIVTLLSLMNETPKELLDAAKKLNYRNTVLVYLKIDQIDFDFHYVTAFDHSLEVGRITNFNKWKLECLSGSNFNVLCMEYWCANDNFNWTCSDEEIILKAKEELLKSKIINNKNNIEGKVLRILRSHPVLSTEHVSALEKINNYLSGFKNLNSAGRHATFKWDGQADNISAGIRLSEKISTL